MKRPTQKTLRLRLSEIESQDFDDLKIAFQERSIRPIIKFFLWANSLMLIAIFIFAGIEHFYPPTINDFRIVTDKVLIAAVGGTAFQSGAILIAAFRGLFSR